MVSYFSKVISVVISRFGSFLEIVANTTYISSLKTFIYFCNSCCIVLFKIRHLFSLQNVCRTDDTVEPFTLGWLFYCKTTVNDGVHQCGPDFIRESYSLLTAPFSVVSPALYFLCILTFSPLPWTTFLLFRVFLRGECNSDCVVCKLYLAYILLNFTVIGWLSFLRPIHTVCIYLSTGVHSGTCDIKIVTWPCPPGSAWTPPWTFARSPKLVTMWTVCVESTSTAHALLYNQLLHTPVHLVHRQHWIFQVFFLSVCYPDLLSVTPVSLCCQQSFICQACTLLRPLSHVWIEQCFDLLWCRKHRFTANVMSRWKIYLFVQQKNYNSSHSGKNVLFFMSAEPLFFSPVFAMLTPI